MKNFTKLTWLLLLIIGSTFAQQDRGIKGDENWLNGWTEFKPKTIEYGEPNQILVDNISEDMTLSKRNVYLLTGNVFITNNAVLSIEPGTVILADSDTKATLTITKGAAIIAEGTETDPIIFTSNSSYKKAGDWGGIIVLGDAPTNKYGNTSSASAYYPNIDPSDYEKTSFGGENTNNNSGILQFVRIEYAGKKLKHTKNSNALLLGGLGSETTISNVMVSFSGDNAFSVMGGNIDLNKMVSFKSKGNDYEFNYGVHCNISNSLAVRSPYISSTSGARCMKVMSYSEKGEVDFSKNKTEVLAKNVTLLTDSDNVESDIASGLVREALYVGEQTTFKINNSVVSGFGPAALLSEDISIDGENLSKIEFANTLFNNCEGNIFTENNLNNEDLEHHYGNPVFFNGYSKKGHTETFINVDSRRPDYRMIAGEVGFIKQ